MCESSALLCEPKQLNYTNRGRLLTIDPKKIFVNENVSFGEFCCKVFFFPDSFRMSRGGGGGGIGGGDNGGFNNYNDNYNDSSSYNTYGLSASFLNSLGIQGPLHTKVFVANVSINFTKKNCLFLYTIYMMLGSGYNLSQGFFFFFIFLFNFRFFSF